MILDLLKQQLQNKGELYLSIKVRPQAGESAILNYQAEVLKVNLKAAPEKGKANAELLKLLAKEFGKNYQIKIISGAGERTKLIKINLSSQA